MKVLLLFFLITWVFYSHSDTDTSFKGVELTEDLEKTEAGSLEDTQLSSQFCCDRQIPREEAQELSEYESQKAVMSWLAPSSSPGKKIKRYKPGRGRR